MKFRSSREISLFKFLLLIFLFSYSQAVLAADGDWPQFRGTQASGYSSQPAPTEWDVPENKGIAWKTPLPGLSHSSPVIVGDKLFVTTAINESGQADLKIGLYGDISAAQDNGPQKWVLYCLDRKSGKILWEKTMHEGAPKMKRHTKATHANSTPASDGQHVVVLLGAEGAFCYSINGDLVWKKDLGQLSSGYFMMKSAEWGFGSSPVIHQGRLLIQCDVQTNSFLAAYDVKTGKELWKTPRAEVPTWSTPTVISVGEKSQVVVNGYKHTGAYDFETGQSIWKLVGGGDIPVPTPITGHGLIFLTSAHGPSAPIYAVKTNATGDITLPRGQTTNEFMAWSHPRNGNYMQTPLLVGDYLYCCNDAGVLACYDAKTGERIYAQRLSTKPDGYTASPVAAGDHLYFTSESGKVIVVKAGKVFGILRENNLGEPCLSTPAVSAGTLFFHTRNHLIAVR